MLPNLQFNNTEELKTCCANLYESDWAKLLLGDSFHPGGLTLTQRLGERLELQPHHHVLDVASGKGTSSIYLAQRFGCHVTGLDYGRDAIANATTAALEASVADRVTFQQGDAEQLPFPDATFDAIICECAFCTFPHKTTAAAEFYRVLKPNGRIGLSDLTRYGDVPPELNNLLAWIACIADARPPEEYLHYLSQAGFHTTPVEHHNAALSEMVKTIRGRLLGAELMVKLKKVALPGADFTQAKATAKHAAAAVQRGTFGYALFMAEKTFSVETA